MTKNDLTCELDYKAEYERIDAICKKQYMELQYIKELYRSLELENRELRGKLDMVYLIFGGVNRG